MAVFPLTVHLPASGTLPQRDFECFNAIKNTIDSVDRSVSFVDGSPASVGREGCQAEGGREEGGQAGAGRWCQTGGGRAGWGRAVQLQLVGRGLGGGREEVGRPGGGRPGWGREVKVLIYNLVQGLLLK